MVEISAVYGVFVFDGRANYSLRVVSVSVSEFGCRDTREIHTMLADCCFLILRIVHLGSCEFEGSRAIQGQHCGVLRESPSNIVHDDMSFADSAWYANREST